MFDKIKIEKWFVYATCIAVTMMLFGGCTYIDYKVFKSKYPQAGVGSYLWHRIAGD